VVSPASPTISTTPSPTAATLSDTSPPLLTDSATLANGYHPVGTITFRLTGPSGVVVDTETATVNGNGTYTTPTGFTLLSSAAAGTYQWDAFYSGDVNDNAASDLNDVNEQVIVSSQAVLPTADLVLTKQVNPTRQIVGFNVTYTFILNNNGPLPDTNVTVTDPFPAGLTVVGPNTASQGFFDPASGVWHVGTMPANSTATLTVTARVEVLGTIANTAEAQGDEFDPNLANNVSGVTLIGEMPPGAISKRFFLSGNSVMVPAVEAVPAALLARPPAAPLAAAQASVASLLSAAPVSLNAPIPQSSPILFSGAGDGGPAGGALNTPMAFSQNGAAQDEGSDGALPVDQIMAEWGQGTATDEAEWLGAAAL
jgi:uncharacterized repeat protein (TIGR01451 family)